MTDDAGPRDVRGLDIWTIYDHPRDFPHTFVARRFEVAGPAPGGPTGDIMIALSLDAIRQQLANMGLVCLARNEKDDPKIVECWL